MAPTRKSSVSGRSSGPSSAGPAPPAGAPGAAQYLVEQLLDPLRQQAYLELLHEHAGHPAACAGLQVEAALPRLSNRPGHETLRSVVGVDRHLPILRPATNNGIALAQPRPPGRLADRLTGLAGGGLRLGQTAHARAGVVHPQDEGAQRRVADQADRAWIHLDPLEHVQVQAQAVGDDRFDHVAVRADQVDPFRAEPGVPVPDRGDGTFLHARQGLAAGAGEPHRARVRLHHPPQRFLGQPLDRLPGPVSVGHLGEPVVLGDRYLVAVACRGDRGCRFPAALQRAADDRIQRHIRQPGSHRRRLAPATVVKPDARRAAGEHTSRACRQAMAHQKNQRHAPDSRG